jgi:sigma-E factor negative regulatory protein RseA
MAEENMKEEISALMDGEVDERQMRKFFRELRNDPECRDCWDQYHLIGDTLRNNLPPNINRNFVSNISQAIVNVELPTPVAPLVKHQAKSKRRHPIANPFTGFALAASVAVVAFLGFGMITGEEQATGPRVASSATPSPIAPIAQTLPQSDIRTVQAQQKVIIQPAVESILKNYLNSHRNVAGSTGMSPAVVPYASLVVTQQQPRGE